jgi:hypothetical protein
MDQVSRSRMLDAEALAVCTSTDATSAVTTTVIAASGHGRYAASPGSGERRARHQSSPRTARVPATHAAGFPSTPGTSRSTR